MKKKLIQSLCLLADAGLLLSFFASSADAHVAFFPLLISAAFGLYQAYSGYTAAQEQADIAEQQGKINAEMARRESEADAAQESQEVKAMRDAQRRRRATIEAGYAKSGVLIDGTPADMLTAQAEVDEYNVQQKHYEGNERRKSMGWQADNNQQMSKARASSYKSQANTSLISGLGGTAASVYGMQKDAKYTEFKWY